MSDDAEEDEVEPVKRVKKKSQDEDDDEEYDDVDDDPDYEEMKDGTTDTESVAGGQSVSSSSFSSAAPPVPASSSSSSSTASSSSSSSSRSQSRKRKASTPLTSGKQKQKKAVLGPKPQRDRSNLRAVPEYPSRGKKSDVKDPESWLDYHDLFLPPPPGLMPPLHVFEDTDPQTEFPKMNSDVSGEIRSKLKFVRSNKKPELPDLPVLGTGFRDDLKELQEKCDKATDETNFPFGEVFDAYYDRKMKLHAVRETNRYHKQFLSALEEKGVPVSKHDKENWKDLTVAEYDRYIGTILLLCLVAPGFSYQDCWNKTSSRRNADVQESFNLGRFKQINKFLHFADNDNIDREDKLYKIRHMHELFSENLRTTHCALAPHLSFDEFVAACLSKCSFTVFMPLKRHPRGIRFYAVVDSSRLTLNLHVDTLTKFPGVHPEFVAIENLTVGVLKDFLNKGFRVTLDQGFGSPTILSWLHANKTPACATMRKDRAGVPEQLKWGEYTYRKNDTGTKWVKGPFKPEKKSVDFLDTYQSGALSVLSWQCKTDKFLTFGTTIDNVELDAFEINRKFRERKWRKILVPKPKCIADYYNTKMAGIDLVDQTNAFIGCRMRFNRWTSRVNAVYFQLAVCQVKALFGHYCPNASKVSKTAPRVLQEIVNHKLGLKLGNRSVKHGLKPITGDVPTIRECKKHRCWVSGCRKKSLFYCPACLEIDRDNWTFCPEHFDVSHSCDYRL